LIEQNKSNILVHLPRVLHTLKVKVLALIFQAWYN